MAYVSVYSRAGGALLSDPGAGRVYDSRLGGYTTSGFVRSTSQQGRANINRMQVARTNAIRRASAQRSAQEAQKRSANIRAATQASAAAIRASASATQSSRVLVEFEAGRAQRTSLQQRQSDQAVGKSISAFGASGIQSVGATQEISRQAALTGNIQQSRENVQKEQILGQARQAITGSLAAGTQAQGTLEAGSQFGKIFTAATATVNPLLAARTYNPFTVR